MITAIDPGTDKSAIVTLDTVGNVVSPEIVSNEVLLQYCRDGVISTNQHPVAIEMIACYGMPVGREVFETCLLIGRIMEILERDGVPVRLVFRRDVKIFLCGSMRAKDANIRQALIDKYGVVGTKKNQGPLFGISSHLWSALAIADYAKSNP